MLPKDSKIPQSA